MFRGCTDSKSDKTLNIIDYLLVVAVRGRVRNFPSYVSKAKKSALYMPPPVSCCGHIPQIYFVFITFLFIVVQIKINKYTNGSYFKT